MPDRFIEYPQVINGQDSNILTDGDVTFTGMDARLQPEKLPMGTVAYAQNFRFDQFIATVRKGMAKQSNAIVPVSGSLIVPFTVGSGAILGSGQTDGVFGVLTFSDPNNNNLQALIIYFATQAYHFSAAGTVYTIAYPATETIETTDTVDSFQYGGYVYLSRGDVVAALTIAGITSSSTTAHVDTTTNHNLTSGMYVRISGASQGAYNGIFPVTVTGPKAFTYTIPTTAASPATGTLVGYHVKLPMKWDGVQGHAFTLCTCGVISQNFSCMAGWNFGISQVNRAIVEYARNQIIISQVENVESYDTINGVFTFGPGTADYLIGVTPYQDQQTLVFLRHSIWLINAVSGDVSAMTTQIITNQVGCLSKRTIATCGANVLFLSDFGVFILQPGYELLLRGNSLPLSAPLNPIMQRINYSATNVPCAQYVNNRYYLAVPLDGNTRNNAMLVYNFINQQWESVDTFPNGFYCDYLAVMLNASGVPTLYCLSFEGGLYAYEQNEQDDFAAASQPASQYLINGLLTTRRYTFGTNGLKQFNRAIINFNLIDAGSGFSTSAIITNPDDTKALPSLTSTTANDITRPFIIRKRAYGLQLQFANTAYRGSVINYSVGAYAKDMKNTQTS